jgi:hypothetical protein
MKGKFLLGVFSGAVGIVVMSSGLTLLAGADDQSTSQPTPEKAGVHDAHVIQIKNEFALKQLNGSQEEQMRLAKARRQKELELKIRKERLKQIASAPIPPEEVDALISKDPGIIQLQKEMQEANQVLTATAQVLKDGKNSAIYKRLEGVRDIIGKELAKRQEEMRQIAAKEIRQARLGQLESETALLEDEINYLRSSEREMQTLVDQLIANMRNLGMLDQEATSVARKLSNMDQKLDKILERLEKLEKGSEKRDSKK